MKADLEKRLIDAAPTLYRNYGGDEHNTCMTWGFECGDGWFNLLLAGSLQLERYINTLDLSIEEMPVASQVKEKFGSLRFYMDNRDEVCSAIASVMESLSSITCEVCGSPGHIVGGGWLRTLCDKCRDGGN